MIWTPSSVVRSLGPVSHSPTNVTLRMTVETTAMKVTAVRGHDVQEPRSRGGQHPCLLCCTSGWGGLDVEDFWKLFQDLWCPAAWPPPSTWQGWFIHKAVDPALPCRDDVSINVMVRKTSKWVQTVINSYTDLAHASRRLWEKDTETQTIPLWTGFFFLNQSSSLSSVSQQMVQTLFEHLFCQWNFYI